MPSLLLLRCFYLVSLGALGAIVPFLSARLESAGLSGGQVGALLAMLPLGRLLSAPLWGGFADRYRASGLLLRLGCAMGVAGALVILFAANPVVAGVGLLLFAAGRVPFGPLLDAATLHALSAPGRDPRDYGRVRLWGSIGFLGVALIAGRIADSGGNPLSLGAALMGATLLLSFRFPARGHGGPAPVLPALRALARQPFLAPMLGMACLQGLTLSVYDTFFGAHVQALGLPASVTAAAVGVGVAGEIAVMQVGRRLFARLGAPRALLLAALVGVPRWWLTSWLTDPVALVGVQVLHAIVFGVFWIAGVQLMAERAPREVSASAQSLFAAASYGVGALVGAFVAGEVREEWGTGAIFLALMWASVGASALAGVLVWRVRTSGREQQAR